MTAPARYHKAKVRVRESHVTSACRRIRIFMTCVLAMKFISFVYKHCIT